MKPIKCHFCRGTPRLYEAKSCEMTIKTKPHTDKRKWWMECRQCTNQTELCQSKELALKRWNQLNTDAMNAERKEFAT